jgi:predicted DsbA family dithiol-disulfide isomerase
MWTSPASLQPYVKVEIWSDIACPWCFIGKRRFERGLEAFVHKDQVDVVWHSYQLDPGLPEHYDGSEIDYLVGSKGMPRDAVQQMVGQVKAQAEGEGLHFDFDTLVVANSLRAHHLLHFAAAEGRAPQVKEALLAAHFEQGIDIGSADELVRIATEAGLDAEAARAALDDPQIRTRVEADFAQAAAYGIRGVPFYVIDQAYGVSGAQPAEAFTAALQQAWNAKPRLIMAGTGTDQESVCGPDGCAI